MKVDCPRSEDIEMNGRLWHVEQRVGGNQPCFHVRRRNTSFGTMKEQQNYMKRTLLKRTNTTEYSKSKLPKKETEVLLATSTSSSSVYVIASIVVLLMLV